MTEPSHDPLDRWVSETAPRALGFALTLVRHRHDAEDIVHDCYSRLIAGAERYDLPRDGMRLLFKSITHACINHTQRRRPEQRPDQASGSGDGGWQTVADRRAAGPVEGAMRRELEQAVEAAMDELPVAQRAAVELRSMGHSLVEVAEMLEVSHANARVMLHRARSTLAVRLRPFLEERV